MDTQDNLIKLSQMTEVNDSLTDLLRQGAIRMLAAAIEQEVTDFLASYAGHTDEQGRKLVVRNGYLPERDIQTGLGKVPVKAPRVRDNSGQSIQFQSKLLPKYLRRTQSLTELLPWLYLKGLSTNDFPDALESLLGEKPEGLSSKSICRLKAAWSSEYEAWCKRDLSQHNIVYLWVDGVYLNARLADKQCILVVIGADESCKKHVLGLQDGFRESSESWQSLLLDLKSRGLSIDPKIAVGDGAMGFWKALACVYPETKQQRCWVHKTANVLNKLPKSLHTLAKKGLHAIWQAPERAEAEKAFELFIQQYQAKYPKATHCLEKDKPELLAFYDFPAEHWHHLRTTNPIESIFATVKLRTAKTRGCLSRQTAFAMLYKLVTTAESKWSRLRGSEHIADVIRGVKFENGIKVLENAA